MSGEYTDTVLACVDCKSEFIWTAGEQRFYEGKGLTQPKRCKECRAAKKQMRANGIQSESAAPPPFYDKDQEDRDNAKDNRRRRRRGY